MLNSFINGDVHSFTFTPTSAMAKILGQEESAFTNFATAFEQQALAFYNSKGTLEGFDGQTALRNLGLPEIKETLFMHTVLGGTQQWNAQIRQISATEIKVQYTVYDRFGAGTDDARHNLPDLPSLYWLQHNSAHYYPSTAGNYNPFIWSIQVNR